MSNMDALLLDMNRELTLELIYLIKTNQPIHDCIYFCSAPMDKQTP